jgi:hypothetical protein
VSTNSTGAVLPLAPFSQQAESVIAIFPTKRPLCGDGHDSSTRLRLARNDTESRRYSNRIGRQVSPTVFALGVMPSILSYGPQSDNPDERRLGRGRSG